jgi:energy-coupling factor transporter ATP-binding protein EcfA2
VQLRKVRIRNFRSIEDLTLDVRDLAVFCGPNSCGKSNLFRALQFAFRPDSELSKEEIYRNMSASKRDSQGAPLLSIWIDLTFDGCPASVCKTAGVKKGEPIEYNFRAIRNGTVTRRLGATRPESGTGEHLRDALAECFHVQYVPPIRDLSAGGMEPFRRLLAEALKRARGSSSLSGPQHDAQGILKDKATTLLADHATFVEGTLHADGLAINTEAVSLESLYQLVTLDVYVDGQSLPLEDLGTGHQSALIIHLFRQLGEVTEGDTLFLFEEPGNHLHPSTIRAIGDDLRKLSDTTSAQVFVTTHSPVLLSHLGFDDLYPLQMGQERKTQRRQMDLGGLSDRHLRAMLQKYGLRLTEPLFARRIIVCEGLSDVVVLSRLIERRCDGVTPDQLDLVVIAVDSSAHVAEVAHLLSRMDVDWRAVLDWDTAYGGRSPQTRADTARAERQAAVEGLDATLVCLEPDRRNKWLRKTIKKLKSELTDGRPESVLYEGSKLEKLLEGEDCPSPILVKDRDELLEGLQKEHVTVFQPVLNKYNVWLWRSDLEGEMLRKSDAADKAELILVNENILDRQLTPNEHRVPQLCATLHNKAQDPLILQRVVDELDEEGLFNYTQMNRAIDFLIDGIA